jgi:hypothetical protein
LETNDAVYALVEFDGDLIAGGDFTVAGSVIANYIARWDGSNWYPLDTGMNGSVYALTVFDGNLIAGGAFTTAGGTTANYLAEWNGFSWTELDIDEPNDEVHALCAYAGNLVAGGKFTQVGVGGFPYIASFDGASWDTLGTGLNDWVVTLGVNAGTLIAGGWFTEAGGVSANCIASWDGASWSALGGGMNWGVYALETYSGATPDEFLVAGGLFTTADGNWSPGIASWDGGSWDPVGPSGMNHGVYGLTVYDGDLIAGGSFTLADTVPANRIACWDGIEWAPLGYGMDNDVWVVDLYTPPLAPSDDLIAGGKFVQAGDTLARHIAKWDGIEWLPLGELDLSGVENEHRGDPAQIRIVARPNPFSDRVALAVHGARRADRLDIFDVGGRLVKSIRLETGDESQVAWDGRSAFGREVPTGIYFLRVGSDKSAPATRIVKIR